METELLPAQPAKDYAWEFWNSRDIRFPATHHHPLCVKCAKTTNRITLLDHECEYGNDRDMVWMCTSCFMEFREESKKIFEIELKITLRVEHSSIENAIDVAKHNVERSLSTRGRPELIDAWCVHNVKKEK